MASIPPESEQQDIVVIGQQSAPAGQLTARQLMTLGMFVFGMDTAAYSEFSRRMSWNHATTERHMARAASQYTGPGEDSITLAGTLVPEIAGSFGSLEQLEEMAGTGDAWPLLDGLGRVLGIFRIGNMDLEYRAIMAGGLPRAIGFTLELVRVDG